MWEQDRRASFRQAAAARHARVLLDEAWELFDRSADGPLRRDWREALAGPISHLVEQARAADLLVVGRPGSDDIPLGTLGVSPGPVLMEAARPVLVVPPRVEHLRGARIVHPPRPGCVQKAARAKSARHRRSRQSFASDTSDSRPESYDSIACACAAWEVEAGSHRSTPIMKHEQANVLR